VRDDINVDDIRWRAVKSIKRTETKFGTNVEYVLFDKLSAIEKLIKILAPSQEPPDGSQGGGNTTNVTNNNVTQIAVVPVPSGVFLPAPPSPYIASDDPGKIIEHSSAAPSPIGVSVASRAFVPMESNG